jgi:nitrogenase-associated protein
MAIITFYEKPGCGGNKKQRQLLEAAGHTLVVKDLLSEPWTAETLKPFLGDKPVDEWFNPSAPKIKSGELEIGHLDAEAAMQLLLDDHILIRRPLLQVGSQCHQGFDAHTIDEWVGLQEVDTSVDLETCQRHTPCAPEAQ